MNEQETRIADAPAEDDRTVVQPAPGPGGIHAGTLLANTYRVERLLGGGGMGEVYLAQHTSLDTWHAIKVIRPSMAKNRQMMELFYREARVLRGMRHDAVVSYDGFMRDDADHEYLVMEYVEGPALSERMLGGGLTVDEVLVLRDRLAAGLGAAHQRNAVHRDISPDNIILPGNRLEAAKLIDFGLSKITNAPQESILGATFAGKFRYASPEQFGLFGGVVDARSDIYSLGLTLAAAAQGRPLHMGENFEDAIQARRKVPDLSALPEELRGWLKSMLEPNPAHRLESLEVLAERWPAGAGVRTSSGKHGVPAWVLSVLAVVVLAGGGFAGYQWWNAGPVDPVPGPVPAQTRNPPEGAPSGGSADRQEIDPPVAPSAPAVVPPVTPAFPEQPVSKNPPQLPVTSPDRLPEPASTDPLEVAFEQARTRLENHQTLDEQPTLALARELREQGRLDKSFLLIRGLADQGNGAAAFLLAEMYDPNHWSPQTSAFSKPNPRRAREWYQRARDLGVENADARLAALAEENPP